MRIGSLFNMKRFKEYMNSTIPPKLRRVFNDAKKYFANLSAPMEKGFLLYRP